MPTTNKTVITTSSTTIFNRQKHPFHILDSSPFPFLTGLFLAFLVIPMTFSLHGAPFFGAQRSRLVFIVGASSATKTEEAYRRLDELTRFICVLDRDRVILLAILFVLLTLVFWLTVYLLRRSAECKEQARELMLKTPALNAGVGADVFFGLICVQLSRIINNFFDAAPPELLNRIAAAQQTIQYSLKANAFIYNFNQLLLFIIVLQAGLVFFLHFTFNLQHLQSTGHPTVPLLRRITQELKREKFSALLISMYFAALFVLAANNIVCVFFF